MTAHRTRTTANTTTNTYHCKPTGQSQGTSQDRWHDDLEAQTWPRYSQDVPVHQ